MGRRRIGQSARLALGAALVLSVSGSASGAGVDDFRTKLEKWVETRQIISEERSEWEVERESLEATRRLLEQEKQALELEVQELEESNTATDDERRDLLLQRGESQRASRALEDRIRGLEEQVLEVAPRLPGPLQDRLEPLLVQIPENPDTTRVPLGQRLMSVLGVLAQAEKWNSTATFVGETRSVGGDEQVQVRTLYWGLGQAFYVDAKGEAAGIGSPGAAGWEFTSDSGLASDAELLLDIYEGNVDTIQFVELPVVIR